MFQVTNMLPNRPIVPVDLTVMAGPNGQMVMDLPFNRVAVHLHGGLTPWFSDGTPFQWFDPKGMVGPSFMNVPGRTRRRHGDQLLPHGPERPAGVVP